MNIIVFAKNHNFLDAAFDQVDPAAEQVGVTPVVAHDLLSKEYTVNEEGYVFMYIANENPTQVDAYFDDVAMTYTPTNIVQYNEYYPFGLQTSSSWTRDSNANNFLYNAGNELNSTTGMYETFFRGYDPALGRFLQVDPLAYMTHNMSAYQYANNSPSLRNDPLSLKSPAPPGVSQMGWDRMQKIADRENNNYSFNDWSESFGGAGTITINITRTWLPYTLDPNDGFWRDEYDISVDELIDEQTQGGYGVLFNSMDAAAIDWGLRYNDNSIQSGKEFGSSIYQVGRKFAYTKPRIGTDEVEPSPSPKKYKTVAVIHSHAKFANGNEYSDADMEYSRDNHFPVYLATPMGALLKYPGTYVNDGIYQFLPSDSRDPLRRNTVDSSIGPKDEPTWGFRDSWDYWWNN